MADGMGGASSVAPVPRAESAIVELRDYTLRPGQRDVLIDLFERTFIEEQERVGMEVIDHFRDLDDPDRFVWLRGFPEMASRAEATEAFYTGAVWQANRDAANATMIDSDNVLLLRPARPAAGYRAAGERPRSAPPRRPLAWWSPPSAGSTRRWRRTSWRSSNAR